MGEVPQYSSLTGIPGHSYSVVAPFAADSTTHEKNEYVTSSVKYTLFTLYDFQMSIVSRFIQSETGDSFSGTRMMVAEWDHVYREDGYSVSCDK